MKQKEIYYADLIHSSRAKKKILVPVVIISGNVMNENLGMCIVCPMTYNIKNYPGCPVIKKSKTNKLKGDLEILTFQITTISRERLVKKIGEITKDELYNVIEGLINVIRW